MSETSFEKSHTARLALVDSLATMASEPPPPRIRRSLGERSLGRSARLIATIAERLSTLAAFGRLQDCDLYTIGQLSLHLQVSLRTLRFYEQAGLLRPERDGTKRLYTRQDLDRLKVIVVLRELEASLTEIKGLMSALDAEESEADVFLRIAAMLSGLRSANDERIAELHRLNDRISETQGCLLTTR